MLLKYIIVNTENETYGLIKECTNDFTYAKVWSDGVLLLYAQFSVDQLLEIAQAIKECHTKMMKTNSYEIYRVYEQATKVSTEA